MTNALASQVGGWLLPALLLWPLIGAVIVRLVGRDVRPAGASTSLDAMPADALASGGPDARVLTLLVLLVEAALGVLAWFTFDGTADGWQLTINLPWLPDLGARLALGVDGISLPMLVLTTCLMPLALLATWRQIATRVPTFGALLLALTSGLVGVFTALDLLLFYLAWELMLIPMYFIIGIWGASGRTRAAIKYVILTMFGSLLMLAAIAALYVQGGATSFHLDDLLRLSLGESQQLWLFTAFFLAFAIKSALVPFHTWLPDAQFEAPVIGAVVLGLKVGTYAILRFALPLFPLAATHEVMRSVILILSVIAIVYGALVAMVQPDLRKVLSYSSISHLGFIMLGCFALTQTAVQGAVMIMVNHGITTSALFLLAGVLRERGGHDTLASYGGLARIMPLFAVMLTLSMLSTVGLPGTNGFVGEFLVLIGSFGREPWLVGIATTGVIFAAVYALRAVQLVLFGPAQAAAPEARTMGDLRGRELGVLAVFAVAMLWLGVAPQPVLQRMERASAALIARVDAARGATTAAASSKPLTIGSARGSLEEAR
ncbi:MAG: NADH-quinone oxidoreductase subunit M [Gemmatimonadaceae bacterium]|jgi:NADH-quinone oxidoreductase subunit M|nr:NADH-quinone oxidoreductase subunit M [Gemmatimonadaceae bacterium]